MKDDVIENLERAKDYIENHSISKLDLLLYLQDLNTIEGNEEVVKGFYYKFFREKDKDEVEEER